MARIEEKEEGRLVAEEVEEGGALMDVNNDAET
jgi:hypothetical protein